MDTKYEQLAMHFFFSGGNITESLEKYGLELKPGKTISDVKKAMNKGMAEGAGKFELEMQCCGIAFEKVLQEKQKQSIINKLFK